MKIRTGIEKLGKGMILLIFSIFTIFPFVWMILSALKTKAEIMDVRSFFPAEFQWHNFYQVIFESPLLRYVGNSLFVSVITLALQIVTGAMIAYAIVFMNFKGKKALFAVIMGTYMLPTAATYISSYIILANWNLLNTFTGLIISNWKILWRVVCPMTKSSFITFGLMNFITCYNSYMWPSLITDADEKMMVSQGLRKFFIEGGAYGTEWPLVMAGSTLIVLPLLILFAFTQKWFINGIGGDTGMKG